MIQFWLVVSTVCFPCWPCSVPKFEENCIQAVFISTVQPIANKGETVYQVTQREPHNHVWINIHRSWRCKDISDEQYTDYQIWPGSLWEERCRICGKNRRKVIEEKWIEE